MGLSIALLIDSIVSGQRGRMKRMHFVPNFLGYDLRASTAPPFAWRGLIAKGTCVKFVSGEMWVYGADAFCREFLRYFPRPMTASSSARRWSIAKRICVNSVSEERGAHEADALSVELLATTKVP